MRCCPRRARDVPVPGASPAAAPPRRRAASSARPPGLRGAPPRVPRSPGHPRRPHPWSPSAEGLADRSRTSYAAVERMRATPASAGRELGPPYLPGPHRCPHGGAVMGSATPPPPAPAPAPAIGCPGNGRGATSRRRGWSPHGSAHAPGVPLQPRPARGKGTPRHCTSAVGTPLTAACRGRDGAVNPSTLLQGGRAQFAAARDPHGRPGAPGGDRRWRHRWCNAPHRAVPGGRARARALLQPPGDAAGTPRLGRPWHGARSVLRSRSPPPVPHQPRPGPRRCGRPRKHESPAPTGSASSYSPGRGALLRPRCSRQQRGGAPCSRHGGRSAAPRDAQRRGAPLVSGAPARLAPH
mmetsp:Transcript_121850/g.272309  ORF Transcript_121850/g.272309 Transcript_121850/m.272309 type:complete len:353 (+) Transcript_121850:243-1301(+)